MKKYNIVTKRTYIPKGSEEEKAVWTNVGTLTEFQEGEFSMELGLFPTTKFYVFPQEKKEKEVVRTLDEIADDVPTMDIDESTGDIPF